MNNWFHEAAEALNLAKRDYTAVSSLNAMAANAVNQACENAVRALWEMSTGIPFSQDHFTPYHKPAVYVRRMGIESYYSAETRTFLAKLDGWVLDDVRYWHTQPYKDHTKPSAHGRGKEIIDGASRFLVESESLSARKDVQEVICRYKDTNMGGR